jgi:hypothetical protein
MRGSIGRRLAVFVAVAAMAVGVAVTPAHAGGASTQSTWNVFAEDLMKSTESNPWPLECLGGPRKHKVFYLPAFADQDFECSVPAGAKVLALPAALICWTDDVTPDAKAECEQVWADDPLVSASITLDGKRVEIERVRAKGKTRFPAGSLLGEPGASTEYFQILRGAVIPPLRHGDHVVVTSFAYAGGFAGTNTYTLHVG